MERMSVDMLRKYDFDPKIKKSFNHANDSSLYNNTLAINYSK